MHMVKEYYNFNCYENACMHVEMKCQMRLVVYTPIDLTACICFTLKKCEYNGYLI